MSGELEAAVGRLEGEASWGEGMAKTPVRRSTRLRVRMATMLDLA